MIPKNAVNAVLFVSMTALSSIPSVALELIDNAGLWPLGLADQNWEKEKQAALAQTRENLHNVPQWQERDTEIGSLPDRIDVKLPYDLVFITPGSAADWLIDHYRVESVGLYHVVLVQHSLDDVKHFKKAFPEYHASVARGVTILDRYAIDHLPILIDRQGKVVPIEP